MNPTPQQIKEDKQMTHAERQKHQARLLYSRWDKRHPDHPLYDENRELKDVCLVLAITTAFVLSIYWLAVGW